jgi:LPXTG-motif cell wall-anchored protein
LRPDRLIAIEIEFCNSHHPEGNELNKVIRSMSVLALASLATLGMAPSAFSEEIYYSNEDGADIFVENCVGADFTVTIDGTDYAPGDVASGFSLRSEFSVSAGAGVAVGFIEFSIAQGSYGHGVASLEGYLEEDNFLELPDGSNGDWYMLYGSDSDSFFPSIFYAECPGDVRRYAYIQTFPGLTLEQVGYAANLEQGVYLSDRDRFESLDLDECINAEEEEYLCSSLAFAPMANFRNPAYAFWANWLEAEVLGLDGNELARFYFDGDPGFDRDVALDQGVWGVWAWVGFDNPDVQDLEFASSFYAYSNGSDELIEIGIDDVFEEAVTPAPAAPATTSPTLATTGANVEWLIVSGLLAGMAGSGFLALSRRKRIW